jgi:uncharacterized protein (TIGR02246 family)
MWGRTGRKTKKNKPTKTTMKKPTHILLAACAAVTTALASGPAAENKPAESEIIANFEAWKNALATKDPKTVAALFAPDAILQPTVSNEIRNTPAKVESYFVDFLKLSPSPTINERHIRALDENTAIDSGVWTFDLVRDGKSSWVTARYCFVWEKKDGEWKIQLLHSSKMPEAVEKRPAALGE